MVTNWELTDGWSGGSRAAILVTATSIVVGQQGRTDRNGAWLVGNTSRAVLATVTASGGYLLWSDCATKRRWSCKQRQWKKHEQ